MNTLGKLFVNSIKLMFDNVDREISCNSTEEYDILMSNENYARRLVNILPAINSGLQQAVRMNAYPSKLVIKKILVNTSYLDMNAQVNDYFRIVSIAWDDADGELRINTDPIVLTNGVIRLPVLDMDDYPSGVELAITYLPKPPQFELAFGFSEDTLIPDDVYNALPYWVKSVLYEVDEPELALKAKNTFYEMLSANDKPKETNTYVRTVY